MLIQADARRIPLGDGSCQMVCTSPPYWGLRSYLRSDDPNKTHELGLEPTPELYVEHMVEVFREVWRVLRDDGTCWLNLGDSYASGGTSNLGRNDAGTNSATFSPGGGNKLGSGNPGRQGAIQVNHGLKPKDLVGIPWRVAFALQADGWYLRSDIIWHKPNPMPESVTDRPTKAHEYVFLLAKSQRYYYDAEAIREPSTERSSGNVQRFIASGNERGRLNNHLGSSIPYEPNGTGRNRRTVWTIATRPYSGAHFATYPPALIEPCILAGTSARGACPECGGPRERVVEKRGGDTEAHERPKRTGGMASSTSTLSLSGNGSKEWAERGPKTTTTGWRPTCSCGREDVKPCVVLDPFAGSGTTGMVAIKHGRDFVGLDLNGEYLHDLATERVNEIQRVLL